MDKGCTTTPITRAPLDAENGPSFISTSLMVFYDGHEFSWIEDTIYPEQISTLAISVHAVESYGIVSMLAFCLQFFYEDRSSPDVSWAHTRPRCGGSPHVASSELGLLDLDAARPLHPRVCSDVCFPPQERRCWKSPAGGAVVAL